ncbi:MAG: hypothetical protein AAGI03_18240 [Pseudomonadota bacterium]
MSLPLHIAFGALLSVCIVELALRLPLLQWARRVLAVCGKVRRTVLAKSSDHWKEQAMRAYAAKMVTATAALLALLLALSAAAGGLVLILTVLSEGFAQFLLQPIGLIAVLAVSAVYGVGRVRAG